MRIALLSDIHANWEALETAAKDLKTRRVNKIAVLGDTVGYGANPNECLEWVLENAAVILLGNHELAMWDLKLRSWFNPMAKEAAVWTAGEIRKDLLEKAKAFPYIKEEEGLVFAHGSPKAPEKFEYLLGYGEAREALDSMTRPVCFVGHTHIPCAICAGKKSSSELKEGVFKVDLRDKTILNPGSVGQPRDLDPRLAYGVYDVEKSVFEVFRLTYDNQRAASKIRKAGLPDYLAQRLL